jgi:hypothetical protein
MASERINNFQSEILTAITMRSIIFWAGTPCSSVQVYRRFGEMCFLHFQGSKLNQASNERKAVGLFFDPEDVGSIFLPKLYSTPSL